MSSPSRARGRKPPAAASRPAAATDQQEKGGKKRKRQGQQQQQKIEGIPADLTPVLLHAVKSRRKYLSKVGKETAASLNANNTRGADQLPPSAASVAAEGDVLARVAARSEQDRLRQQAASRGETPLDKARIAAEDATRAFLNVVKREATSGGGGGATRSEVNGWSLEGGSGGNKSNGSTAATSTASSSVPVACLTFLMNLFAEDANVKMTTRRSALALAADLLTRSAECRASFCQADRLREYVEIVASLSPGRNATATAAPALPHNDTESALKATLQREAVELLSELSDRFGSYHPRLTVATRYLEERKGVIVHPSSAAGSSPTTGNNNMDNFRRGRDLAIKHAEKELVRVRKILDRADVCFEILVPRIGSKSNQSPFALPNKAVEKPSIDEKWYDDDEDDGIDWEEGDLDSDANGSNDNDVPIAQNTPYDHEAAVERTLAVMERSRGVEDGEIEIDLGAKREEEGVNDTSASATTAQEHLSRCVDLLTTKHLPRLTFWVDCLITADGMMIQLQQNNISEQSSLVIMSSSLRKKRADTLKILMELKVEVARTLASAARIGIAVEDAKEDAALPRNLRAQTNSMSQESDRSIVNASGGKKSNPTGVGVAMNAAGLDSTISWQKALGIKSQPKPGELSVKDRIAAKAKQRKLGSTRGKSRVQIKLRKGT